MHKFGPSQKIEEYDLSKVANDCQAILVNPPWKELDIIDFQKLKIPTTVMKDGLLFVWINKSHIYEIIMHMEQQDFYYVENVSYVMLDQNFKQGKYFKQF